LICFQPKHTNKYIYVKKYSNFSFIHVSSDLRFTKNQTLDLTAFPNIYCNGGLCIPCHRNTVQDLLSYQRESSLTCSAPQYLKAYCIPVSSLPSHSTLRLGATWLSLNLGVLLLWAHPTGTGYLSPLETFPIPSHQFRIYSASP